MSNALKWDLIAAGGGLGIACLIFLVAWFMAKRSPGGRQFG